MRIQPLMAATLVVAAAAASAVAQDRPASQNVAGKITLTGCVERADQILPRENLGTTVDSLTFVLVKAEEGKRPDQPAAAPPAAGDAGKTYRLDADADMINKHVGHRVEITATKPADAPVGTSGRAGADAPGAAPPPVLKVESVKFLSSTCGR